MGKLAEMLARCKKCLAISICLYVVGSYSAEVDGAFHHFDVDKLNTTIIYYLQSISVVICPLYADSLTNDKEINNQECIYENTNRISSKSPLKLTLKL